MQKSGYVNGVTESKVKFSRTVNRVWRQPKPLILSPRFPLSIYSTKLDQILPSYHKFVTVWWIKSSGGIFQLKKGQSCFFSHFFRMYSLMYILIIAKLMFQTHFIEKFVMDTKFYKCIFGKICKQSKKYILSGVICYVLIRSYEIILELW